MDKALPKTTRDSTSFFLPVLSLKTAQSGWMKIAMTGPMAIRIPVSNAFNPAFDKCRGMKSNVSMSVDKGKNM
jgi:uncharacterized protein (DUF2342 family)